MDGAGSNNQSAFSDQVVVITGGTGSFGEVMARHLLASGCPDVRIFSRDEAKQEAMRTSLHDSRVRFFIGDVRDAPSLDLPMTGADLVFHAAALKQVPTCDFFPMQAVLTNVDGSANVLERAGRAGVRSVVCLSTDKAVYPINAMGMTKALMEKIAQAWARSANGRSPTVSCVRYGNVMYSRGSVIPLFVSCIRERRPLPVTEPSMTRFMMPLRQAVDLVEFALLHAGSGDLFIRKAPACTIVDLATALQQLFRSSSPVMTIGYRHGEKLFETLATKEELRRAEVLDDYLRVRMDDRDLNYDKYFVEGDPLAAATDDYHSHNTYRLNVEEVTALLATLPEIRSELVADRGEPEAAEILASVTAQ